VSRRGFLHQIKLVYSPHLPDDRLLSTASTFNQVGSTSAVLASGATAMCSTRHFLPVNSPSAVFLFNISTAEVFAMMFFCEICELHQFSMCCLEYLESVLCEQYTASWWRWSWFWWVHSSEVGCLCRRHNSWHQKCHHHRRQASCGPGWQPSYQWCTRRCLFIAGEFACMLLRVGSHLSQKLSVASFPTATPVGRYQGAAVQGLITDKVWEAVQWGSWASVLASDCNLPSIGYITVIDFISIMCISTVLNYIN